MKNIGKLVVIEGADGAGKETQTKMLVENLRAKGMKVATLAFPRYSDTVGGKILNYSLGKMENKPDFEFSKLNPIAASLPYAMDRYESKEEVEKMLQENDVVVLDRYYTANILHQGAKFESELERGEFIKNLETIELGILQIPKPDFVFYLSLPYEVSVQRMDMRAKMTGESKDQVEMDTEYIKRSIEKGRRIAEYCGWKVVECVTEKDGENYELTREEISEIMLRQLLENVDLEKSAEISFNRIGNNLGLK